MVEKARITILLVAIFGFIFFAGSASAATIYFSPSSGSYEAGGAIVVNVNVASVDQAMNAASGVISFPQDKLEVTSLSKTGSIFSLWAQEPSFSNTYGTITFEGIVLNPGFTGSLGRMLTINFRSKAQGLAVLNFSSASILANDGNGTNILSSSGSANLTLGKPTALLPSDSPLPSGLKISSSTHPNQSKWYPLNKAEFSWQLPAGTTSIRLLFDRLANAIPTIEYVPPVSSKEITDIPDGIYYFHARTKSDSGWSGVSHFKFQIDTQEPDYFTINEIRRQDLTNPRAKFNFDAKDSLSGIDHYEVSIDGGEPQTWEDDGTHVFETYPVEPGKHTLSAKALDRAGNFLASSLEFSVNPLGKVTITEYPKQLNTKESLVIKGNGPLNTNIVLFMQKSGGEILQYETPVQKGGMFVVTVDDGLKEGVYKTWAHAIDNREAKSNPSNEVVISIRQSAFLKIGNLAISVLAILIPIIALVFLLILLVLWMRHQLHLFRKKLRKEVREAGVALHQAFNLLESNMRKQVALLEKAKNKRALTREEEMILKKFKQDLDDAEKFVAKEIKDIEREIK